AGEGVVSVSGCGGAVVRGGFVGGAAGARVSSPSGVTKRGLWGFGSGGNVSGSGRGIVAMRTVTAIKTAKLAATFRRPEDRAPGRRNASANRARLAARTDRSKWRRRRCGARFTGPTPDNAPPTIRG